MTHAAPTTLRRRYLQKLLGFTPSGEPAQALDAVARLRVLHRPFGIYDDCGHAPGGDDHTGKNITYCGSFETCLPPAFSVCAHCCRDEDGQQTEACARDHDHLPGEPVCETAAILGGGR